MAARPKVRPNGRAACWHLFVFFWQSRYSPDASHRPHWRDLREVPVASLSHPDAPDYCWYQLSEIKQSLISRSGRVVVFFHSAVISTPGRSHHHLTCCPHLVVIRPAHTTVCCSTLVLVMIVFVVLVHFTFFCFAWKIFELISANNLFNWIQMMRLTFSFLFKVHAFCTSYLHSCFSCGWIVSWEKKAVHGHQDSLVWLWFCSGPA